MQQFTVPQFIDVEDKIIGPITVRQFIIILAAFLIDVALFRLFQFLPFLTSAIIVTGLAAVFAFYRINGMPFHFFVLNFTQTLKRPTLRVWNQMVGKIETEFVDDATSLEIVDRKQKADRRIGSSRLTELSLIVDTSGKYKGEEDK